MSCNGIKTNENKNQSMVSPTNASGTSISALTFDESIFQSLHVNTRHPGNIFHQDEREREPRIMVRDHHQKGGFMDRNQAVQTFTKGTLLGRIMQQLNQQSSIHQENSETFRNDLIVKDPIHDKVESNQPKSNETTRIMETVNTIATDDLDAKMVDAFDASSIHEVSLSSYESAMDEWREVKDKLSGKTYYYNRRTRQSTWILPLNATVTRRRERRGHSTETFKEYPFCSNIDYTVTHEKEKKDIPFKLISNSSMSQDNKNAEFNSSNDEWEKEYCGALDKNEEDNGVYMDSSSSNLNLVFCMYCGDKFPSVASLPQHFNLCKERLRAECQCPGLGQTVAEALMRSYSPKIESFHGCEGKSIEVDTNKENLPTTVATKGQAGSNRLNMLSSGVFGGISSARENDTRKGGSKVVTSDDVIASPQTSERRFIDVSNNLFDSDHSYDEEEFFSDVYCSCPFCRRPFKSGNKLSRHLLCCKERRNSSRKRRSGYPRNDGLRNLASEDSRNSTGPNLQTALITDGGRPLPGYPKLSRSPLQNS